MKITVKCPGGPVLFERVLDAREVVRVKRIVNGEELPGGPNAEGVILLPGQHLDVPGRPLARQGVPWLRHHIAVRSATRPTSSAYRGAAFSTACWRLY